MTEWVLQYLAFSKVIATAICGLLYGIGGMWEKWVRRYVMPVLALIFIVFFSAIQGSFSWWYLLFAPLLSAAFHLPYGATDLWMKILLRLIFGLAVTGAACPIAWATGNWLLYGYHVLITTVAYVVLGVWNPCKNPRDEETLLGSLAVLLPIFMV
jgi:hypothetical protein